MLVKFISCLLLFFDCNGKLEIGVFKKCIKDKIVNCDYNLLVNPSHFLPACELTSDSVKYVFTFGKDSLVNFIATTDSRFKTDSGLCVGSTYLDSQSSLLTPELYNMPGWGKFIQLKSGWFAGFHYNNPVSNTSKILFFFKMKFFSLETFKMIKGN